MTITETVALYDLIHDCITNQQPMVTLYATDGNEIKARVLYPARLTTTTAGADVVKAHDSLTNQTKTFRLDRIHAAQHLTA